MIPNPIHRALSTFRRNQVRHLLMGGQATILYGAAEFSRDLDLSIACDASNLAATERALRELDAELVLFPALVESYLRRGHAVHHRCRAQDVEGLRVDLMSSMRGCDSFDEMWERRAVLETAPGELVDVLSVRDLVAAKKTQGNKDWPMVTRLVEVDIMSAGNSSAIDPKRAAFWLAECRTPSLLVEIARRFPAAAAGSLRPAVIAAIAGDADAVARELLDEEQRERAADRAYWAPLRAEIEAWRRAASPGSGGIMG